MNNNNNTTVCASHTMRKYDSHDSNVFVHTIQFSLEVFEIGIIAPELIDVHACLNPYLAVFTILSSG